LNRLDPNRSVRESQLSHLVADQPQFERHDLITIFLLKLDIKFARKRSGDQDTHLPQSHRVGADMVQDYAFGGGASASKATLLRSARTRREYRLMRESKMNLNSSLVQEVW
jgi:hypothetical protein